MAGYKGNGPWAQLEETRRQELDEVVSWYRTEKEKLLDEYNRRIREINNRNLEAKKNV